MNQPVTVADKDHAQRSPSGIATRKLCPGSVVLTRGLPRDANRYSAEGTAAHQLAEMCLSGGKTAEAFAGTVIEADGFTFTVGTEMIDNVNDFCDYVREMVDVDKGDTLLVEQEVGIGWFTGEESATGTADVVGIVDGGKRLVVIDLKYGQGVRVDIDSEDGPNEQLVAYAAGALKDNELVYDEIENVTIAIMQPRLQHVAEIELSVVELDFEIDRLAAIEKLCDAAEHDYDCLAAEGEATFENWFQTYLHPGEKQCKFCKAKPTCPALRSEVLNIVTAGAAQGEDFPDITAEPEALPKALAANIALAVDLSPALLAASMRSLGLVEIWIKAIRAETERRLFEDPKSVPGYGIYQGKQGNRAWTDPAAAEATLKAARLKSDEMYSKTVITPPRAEKLLKDKPRLWAKLQMLITRSDGKATVDRDDCGREPWAPVTAESFPDMVVLDQTGDVIASTVKSDPLLQ